MQPIRFSFLLPVRNGSDYIKTCIQSILGQTYPHLNLIVLENESTDGTADWLKSLTDNRIVINAAPRPLSIEENWARILQTNRNEFMVLTGHDDVFAADYLETIVALIEKHPEASIYTTHFTFIDAAGKRVRYCNPVDEIQTGPEFMASLLTLQTDLVGTGFVMRSADYDAVGGIPVRYPTLLFADFTLYHQLSCPTYKATASGNCFSFRLHQSATFTSDSETFQKAFGLVIDYIVGLKKKSAAFDRVINRYGTTFISFYCKSLSHKMLKSKHRKQPVKTFVAACKDYGKRLNSDDVFQPEKASGIKWALWIDSNIVGRTLFRLFRRIYPKPL